MKVFVGGSDRQWLGYGKMKTEVGKALDRRGALSHEDNAGNHLAICLPYHASHCREGQSLTLFSMFETNRIPEDFVEVLDRFDRIFVPCEDNRRNYAEHHPDVRVIPLGVDPVKWFPTRRQPHNQMFTFLTGGNGGGRKGHIDAVRTYAKVRPRLLEKGINSRLLVKCPPEGASVITDAAGEGVDVLAEWQKESLETKMYADAHCYVSFSKGEGWGLMPNQALAQGLPLICTDAAGQSAFAPYAALTVPHHMVEANYGIWGPVGEWWEPDLEAMADAMVEVARHYQLYEAKAWVSAHTHPYFWDNTARQIIENLEDRPDVTGEQITFQTRKFKVITTEDRVADIADIRYGFEKGKEYYVNADVKRILWNAGILHPSVVHENAGLLPSMIENYVPVPTVCPTCARPLPLD